MTRRKYNRRAQLYGDGQIINSFFFRGREFKLPGEPGGFHFELFWSLANTSAFFYLFSRNNSSNKRLINLPKELFEIKFSEKRMLRMNFLVQKGVVP